MLSEQRVGSPGSIDPVTGQRFVTGGVIRVLLSHPRCYQVYALATNGANQFLGSYDERPTYQDLEELLVEARNENLKIFEVARKSSAISSAATYTEGSSISDKQPQMPEALGQPSDAEINAMDVSTLRKYLNNRGLPTSGRVVKLKERLKESYSVDSEEPPEV